MADVTQLLRAHAEGAVGAIDALMPLIYEDLRRIARMQRRRRPDQSLDTTGLVHEAYLRLVDQRQATWHDRRHFLAVSAIAMRQILVDHARTRVRQKRGGGALHEPLDEASALVEADAESLVILDDALRRLADLDARLVRVVECRYFAGLSEQETADALETSLRTVQRDWLKARAWLREQLGAPRAVRT